MPPLKTAARAAVLAVLCSAAACSDLADPVSPNAVSESAVAVPFAPMASTSPLQYSVSWASVERAVDPVTRARTVAQYYSYGQPYGASSNTPDHLETASTITLFLYRDSNTGSMSLVITADKPQDGTGSKMTLTATGLPGDATWSVRDDPGDSPYAITAGSTTVSWVTFPCCTDGGAISGSFDQPFDVTLSFSQLEGLTAIRWVTETGGTLQSFAMPLSAAGEIHVRAAIPNTPPTAVASAPDTVEFAGAPTAQVALDGSASSDADGDALTYSWSEGGSEIATGATPTVELGLGSHVLTLAVSDGVATGTADVTVVVVDPTPPTMTANLSGSAGSGGWFVSPVEVTWTIDDPESPASATAGCTAETAGEGEATYACTASSAGGETTESVTVMVDTQAPAIAFSGNAGTYELADMVAITCAIAEDGSGLAASDCPDATGPAYTFGIGTHTLEASATDVAGNSSSASESFEVVGTVESIGDLIAGWVPNAGVANALIAKLAAADRATSRGNSRASAGAIQAFRNQVRAIAGKWLTQEQADFLLGLF